MSSRDSDSDARFASTRGAAARSRCVLRDPSRRRRTRVRRLKRDTRPWRACARGPCGRECRASGGTRRFPPPRRATAISMDKVR
eukprot:7850-Pelagococcus_subviridis.AAC.1